MKLVFDIIVSLLLAGWPMMLMMSPMMFGAPGAVNDKGNIISVILILCYPVFIFLFFAIFNLDFFGLSGVKVFFTSTVIILLALFAFGYPQLYIKATKGIAASGYSKTTESAYYDGQMIEGADPTTFEPIQPEEFESLRFPDYAKDKSNVFFRGVKVNGANPIHFNPIKKSDPFDHLDYWRDNTHVYYEGKIVPHANPEKFELLKENFGVALARSSDISQGRIYRFGKLISGADPQTFEMLSFSYSKDKNHIYYDTSPILPDANPHDFVLLFENDVFAMDNKNTYQMLGNKSVILADTPPKSLLSLGRSYYKNSHKIFYLENYNPLRPLLEADYASFEVTGYIESTQSDAKDKNNLYIGGQIVK